MSIEITTAGLRRRVLIETARLAWEGQLETGLNKLPYRLAPADSHSYRCCIHHDRAVLKDRAIAALGLSVEDRDESEELTEFAARANRRTEVSNPYLTVLQDACKACVQSHYFVTNACQGCVARPCTQVCPKNSVTMEKGRAQIDGQTCINCGQCQPVCPYHAIIYIPIPCEESCPVGAISKDEQGKEVIDDKKCIYCGKCIKSCPFGAIMERSQITDIIRLIIGGQNVVAMIAPSVSGQFAGSLDQIMGALLKLGFTAAIEVAEGADLTAREEAAEWKERIQGGDKFMTSSCCPAWVRTSRSAMPQIAPFVSHTPSPMVMCSHIAAERYPNYHQVFIGPCVAKRAEARENGIAHVLSFEELGALFESRSIETDKVEPIQRGAASSFGRGFAASGGVTAAVIKASITDHDQTELRRNTGAAWAAAAEAASAPTFVPELINGLNKKSMSLLKVYAMGKGKGNFVEVMACEGGCVAGPGVICSPKVAIAKLEELKNETIS